MHKFHVILSVLFLVILTSFSACSPNQPEKTSALQYGFLPSSGAQLIHVRSGSVIRICGVYQSDITWAISTWGRAINRRYSFESGCTGQRINSYSALDPYAQENCSRYRLQSRMYSLGQQVPQLLVDCGGYGREKILHEVGHLFGLCDQYASELGHCAYNHGVVTGSVMSVANSLVLKDDDIEGIRALAARAGSPTE